MSRSKVAYVITYGLAPVFRDQLVNIASTCDNITVCFDEALNSVAQRCQFDLLVRFWDGENHKVSTRYLNSAFLGRTCAEDLIEAFTACLAPIGLTNVAHISMDGPNVNWKFLRQLKATVNPDQPQVLDLGSCGLHVVNGAFQAGHNKSGWNINGLLRSIYWLFKDTPARRAGFTATTGVNIFQLKFCQVRWTENSRVAERALNLFAALKKYTLKVEPQPAGPLFAEIKNRVCNDRLLECKLHFFKSVAELLEPFLRQFQTPKPMFPFLFTSLEELLYNLLTRLVKAQVLDSTKTTDERMAIDLKNDEKLRAKVDVGFGAHKALEASQITAKDKVQFYSEARAFYVALVSKICERSPLKYEMVRAARCLSPYVLKGSAKKATSRAHTLFQQLVDDNRVLPSKADKAKMQFNAFRKNDIVKNAVKDFKADAPLDIFFHSIFAQLEGFDELWDIVRLVLILSHGNASVESGFSVNGDILVENLSEHSLVAQRMVYDTVRESGGPLEIPVTPVTFQTHSRFQIPVILVRFQLPLRIYLIMKPSIIYAARI